MAKRTIDVAGEASDTYRLASFENEIFFQREGDFLGAHGKILLQVGFQSKRGSFAVSFPSRRSGSLLPSRRWPERPGKGEAKALGVD
jgi:hypothetical protein